MMLSLSLLLTGCYDKVELEDRALVISLGIDKNAELFNVSMEIPTEFENKGEDSSSRVKAINAESVNGAMKKLDAYSGQKLYYGHTKACVLGEELLKDKKLFKQALDGLERNREISRKLIIMTTPEEVNAIYNAKADNNSLTGIFINDFYKNNNKALGTTFRQDLESLIGQLLESNNAVIPVIKSNNNNLEIGQLAVIKDYSLKGYLNEEQSRGFMYLSDYFIGGEITVPFENSNTALKITDKSTDLRLNKNSNGELELEFDIEIQGNIEEYILNKNVFVDSEKYKILEKEYAELIKEEAENTLKLLQKEYKADILGVGEKIRKNFYEDYLRVNGNTENIFDNAKAKIRVEVEIKGAGAVK